MQLSRDLASVIVKKLKSTIDHHINIMDERGVVIASSDEKRIDTIHAGAMEVIRTRRPLIIFENEVSQLAGTKPGVNLPIEFMEELIGVVGITGHPDELLKLAQVAKITVELIVEQNYMKKHTFFEKQLMQSWVMELISPELFDVKKLEKQAKYYFQINVETNHAVLLLQVPALQGKEKVEDLWDKNVLREEVLKMVENAPVNIAFLGITKEDLFVIGIPMSTLKEELAIATQLQKALNQKSIFAQNKIGVGNSKSGLLNIRNSYIEANRSLQLMNKFNAEATISHINDWGFIRMLDEIDPSLRTEMIEQYKLEKLPPHLKETLQILIETDHNFKTTANQLHIHRNTLNYRLDTIEQITGLHPKTMNGLSMLNMLLLFEKLQERER